MYVYVLSADWVDNQLSRVASSLTGLQKGLECVITQKISVNEAGR